MSKFSRTTDGRTMFWCKGCESFHWIDDGWQITGDDETLTVQPSILVNGSTGSRLHARCHSFITNGRIQYLTDCDHALAGQTIDLPDLELIDGSFYSIKDMES